MRLANTRESFCVAVLAGRCRCRRRRSPLQARGRRFEPCCAHHVPSDLRKQGRIVDHAASAARSETMTLASCVSMGPVDPRLRQDSEVREQVRQHHRDPLVDSAPVRRLVGGARQARRSRRRRRTGCSRLWVVPVVGWAAVCATTGRAGDCSSGSALVSRGGRGGGTSAGPAASGCWAGEAQYEGGSASCSGVEPIPAMLAVTARVKPVTVLAECCRVLRSAVAPATPIAPARAAFPPTTPSPRRRRSCASRCSVSCNWACASARWRTLASTSPPRRGSATS